MRLCTDCAHCGFFEGLPPSANTALCRNPLVALVSPVDGGQDNVYCYIERTDMGKCGPSARLFEAKRAAA